MGGWEDGRSERVMKMYIIYGVMISTNITYGERGRGVDVAME